jgi:ketosteroid isomerase-like protein
MDDRDGSERFAEHAARAVSIRSMRAVEAGDREAWLALFADDAIIEDPIGSSPLNPSGEPRRGLAAIAAFYDTVIAGGDVRFEIRESYAAGNEVANVGTITVTFPDGNRSIVDGVYTYRIDDAGRLLALRAFWEFEGMRFEST